MNLTKREFFKVAAAGLVANRVPFCATVPTAHYDNSRNGVTSSEPLITPSNVSSLQKLGSYTLDGPLYNQALYVQGVTISATLRNVIIAATMNNTVYALDADNVGASPLWSTNFGTPWSGYPNFGQFYNQNIGILSTPVVDTVNGFVYVVSVNNTPTFTIRKLNLSTGAQVASTNISASVPGTGTGSSGGTLTFAAWAGNQTQRTPLTLANGKVYFGFGSNAENPTWPNYHGWIFAYDAVTLAQSSVLCLSPNGNGAGVWEAAGGMAVDGSGNLYFATGNGDYDGVANFGQSIVKVNSSLVIQDWFTPSNFAVTNPEDADISAGRVMLIPNTTKLTIGSKDGRIWVVDTGSMGHLQGTGTAPQVFSVPNSFTPGPATGIYGGLFFNSTGFFPVATFPVVAFSFSGSTYNTTAIASTVGSYPQVTLAGSSNGTQNPIVWALTVASSAYSTQRPVTLRAWNPVTLAEYWNSGTVIGNYAKFAAPTVANSRVFVPTSDGTIVVFGLPFSSQIRGNTTLRGNATVR
jgi:hypothetical protein